ncbi:hypothetical protein [Asanoa ferruginea]|nr:hypothetical protein [Asanoa ferruginea]
MPAQEGVNYRESFLAAVARGLSEECDVSIFDREGQLKSNYYLRDIEYVDTLWLPYERWGERAVVGGSEDNFFSQIQMRKKAYWAAFIIVDQMKAVQGRPNLREVNRVEWKTFDNAATLIRGNRSDKAELLFRCLQKGMQHLVGSRRADEWLPELAD